MTSENAAPAGMPGLEEIARAIADNSGWRDADPDARNAAHYLKLARAILALFAPILAEKDAWAERGWNAFNIASDQAMANGAAAKTAEARALAAEAALAGARSNLEKARSDYDNLYEEYEAMSDLSFNRGSLLDEIGRDIWEPAAQRLAQIAAPGAAMEAQ